MIPFTLASPAENFWGLTRIMNLEKLIYGEGSSIQSRDRNKAFICTVQATSSRVFYIGSEIQYKHEEFGSAAEKFETINLNSSETGLNLRSTGLASLITGECYGLGAGALMTNILAGKSDLKAALTICLNKAIEDSIASVVFLESKTSPEDWKACLQTREALKNAGVSIVVP
ncbi:MAG: hypothetical protein K2P92_05445, partial [Bdellovibrionaceae bacterium]|nr:hypothetical protein [Pseudobdellovibrionaceae bacterium]